jgi:hypothetical protein
MTKRELERILKDAGWVIISGTRHDMAVKDGCNTKIPNPDTRETFLKAPPTIF